MPLTETSIRNAKVSSKPRKLSDGSGLYLLLNPNGSRWWRFDYRHAGKRKTLSMGTYPNTNLKDARDSSAAARKLLAAGVDPGEQRKAAKAASSDRAIANLEAITREPSTKQSPTLARSLRALGIDDAEERAYRVLLAHRMATVGDIATLLNLPLNAAQRLLSKIENLGLATHSPERPRRYIASPPEVAIEALANRRHADIEQARLTIPELKEQAAGPATSNEREQVVEVITNRAALGQILTQLYQNLQGEAFGFQRAPMLTPVSQETMRQGVRIRSISDATYLDLPGAVDSLRLVTQMGEEARVFPTLPVKMFVVDRRVGLIPLNAGDPSGPILLVRACALLEALCSLFELIWEKATPIAFTRTGKLEMGKPSTHLSEVAGQLIPLLAAGLNDKAIAHEVGISGTTLTRRIAELMKSSETRTRFQLGWSAALDAFPADQSVNAVGTPARARR